MAAPKRRWDVCRVIGKKADGKNLFGKVGELLQWDNDGADSLSLKLFMFGDEKFSVFEQRERDASPRQDEHNAAKANGYAPDGDIPF